MQNIINGSDGEVEIAYLCVHDIHESLLWFSLICDHDEAKTNYFEKYNHYIRKLKILLPTIITFISWAKGY